MHSCKKMRVTLPGLGSLAKHLASSGFFADLERYSPGIIPFNFSKGSFSIVVSSTFDIWSGGEQQFIRSFSIFEASGRVPAHKKDWLNLLGIQRGAMVDPELEPQPSSFSAFPRHSLACS